MTPRKLFDWADRFARRKESSGQGTQYPTYRQAQKRFGCSYDTIEQAIEDGSGMDGVEYFGTAVGVRSGSGYGRYDNRGDFRIEAQSSVKEQR